MTTTPLSGIRVLDLGTLTPGKYCTYLLAGLGADVVRVERPVTADRVVDSEDLILNQGKRSITLNLRSEAGLSVLLKLAESADVIVEGNRPGTADRNGFGYNAVRGRKDDIVYCSVSAFGATGPLNQAVGYDLIFIALSGLLRAICPTVPVPSCPDAYLADGVSGLSATCAIAVALFNRERTGQGTFIDLAMLDSIFSLLAVSHGVRKESASPTAESITSPLYDVYQAADGSYLVLSAIRDNSKHALFTYLERPDLAASGQATEQRLFLEQALREKRADQWVDELGSLDIEIAAVNHPHEAFDHPQLRERGMVGETSHPDVGNFEYIRPGISLAGQSVAGALSRAPRIGEHTRDVLRSVGISDDRLGVMQADGTI